MGGRDGPSGNTLQQEGPVLQVARLWGPAGGTASQEYIRSMYTYTTGPALDANAGSETLNAHGPRCGTQKFNYSCVLAYDRPGAS